MDRSYLQLCILVVCAIFDEFNTDAKLLLDVCKNQSL